MCGRMSGQVERRTPHTLYSPGLGEDRDEGEGKVECEVEGGVGILACGAVVGGIAE